MDTRPAPIKAAAGAAASAGSLEQRRRRRSRRRLAALAALLILGLALGVVYATGFATTGGVTGSANPANPAFAVPSDSQDTSGLNGKITSSGPLTWNWQGQWGTVDSQAMYTVDLRDPEFTAPPGQKFFVGVFLATPPAGFSDIQLQLRIKDNGAVGTCTPADIEGVGNANDHRIFIFDALDAQVTFAGMNGVETGLDGGSAYCVGVADYSGAGKDPDGTFIRKNNKGPQFNGQFPTFVASLNRME